MSDSTIPTRAHPVNEKERFRFIEVSLSTRLGLKVETIEPMSRGYNNHVHRVHASKITHAAEVFSKQAGTVPLPFPPPRTIIFRMIKYELGGETALRTTNEVAALTLVRESGRSQIPTPNVYDWSSEGWIVMQYLEGVPLDNLWPSLSPDERRRLITDSISPLFASIHTLPHPTLSQPALPIGGLEFSPAGQVITAPHPGGFGGPFPDMAAQWRSMLKCQLKFAKGNRYINGWSGEQELRERLQRFIGDEEEGFESVLKNAETRPFFVHGDFNIRNILVEPNTLRITGLLDFEFARIASAPEEYMDSMEDFAHDCLKGSDDVDRMISASEPLCVSTTADERSPACQLAITMEGALDRLGVEQPKRMKAYTETARLYYFIEQICPWQFQQEPYCTAHDMEAEKSVTGKRLEGWLSHWGF